MPGSVLTSSTTGSPSGTHHHVHARIIPPANRPGTHPAPRPESAASSPHQMARGKNTPCNPPYICCDNRNCRPWAELPPPAAARHPEYQPWFRGRRFFPRPKPPNQISRLPSAPFANPQRARQIVIRRWNPAAPVSPPTAAANPSATGFSPNSRPKISPSEFRLRHSVVWSAPCRRQCGSPRHRSRCKSRRVRPSCRCTVPSSP